MCICFFHFHFIFSLLIIYYCSLEKKNVYQLNDFIIVTYENAKTTTELAKWIAISDNKNDTVRCDGIILHCDDERRLYTCVCVFLSLYLHNTMSHPIRKHEYVLLFVVGVVELLCYRFGCCFRKYYGHLVVLVHYSHDAIATHMPHQQTFKRREYSV